MNWESRVIEEYNNLTANSDQVTLNEFGECGRELISIREIHLGFFRFTFKRSKNKTIKNKKADLSIMRQEPFV